MLARTVLASTLLIVGCGNTGGGTPPASVTPLAPPGAFPAQVTVPGAPLTYGFALDAPRVSTSVSEFRITKRPISVEDYRKCVASGYCSAPASSSPQCAHANGADGPTYSSNSANDNLVLTCVTPDQATTYCAWLGGRLPTASEWLLAARGSNVHRFPWGDSSPTCAQRARVSFFADYPNACCGTSCDSIDHARLGLHDSVMSPAGLTDLLITRAELLGPGPASTPGCGPDSRGCLVVGIAPGAIDGVIPAPATSDAGTHSVSLAAFGYRCAWSGGPQ